MSGSVLYCVALREIVDKFRVIRCFWERVKHDAYEPA